MRACVATCFKLEYLLDIVNLCSNNLRLIIFLYLTARQVGNLLSIPPLLSAVVLAGFSEFQEFLLFAQNDSDVVQGTWSPLNASKSTTVNCSGVDNVSARLHCRSLCS